MSILLPNSKYGFGRGSLDVYYTLCPHLQKILLYVIRGYDIILIEGFRDQVGQEKAFLAGNTNKHWPHGKHNKYPSRAVDLAPYDPRFPGGINWGEKGTPKEREWALRKFYDCSAYIKGVADTLEMKIRRGANWDEDRYLHDHTLIDLPHIECLECK